MKAIVVREHGGPEVLKLEDVPDPVPGPDQVLVRLRAVGVNPVDVYIRSGAYARKPALPFIPGSDAAGEIEAVGANVTTVAAGDRVFIHGTAAEHTHGHYGGAYAEKAVCRLDHIYRLPPSLSGQGAAMVCPTRRRTRAVSPRAPRGRRDRAGARRHRGVASLPCRSPARTAYRHRTGGSDRA
jgi:NADPH2:quinone reductase